jgi:hypothetical protein
VRLEGLGKLKISNHLIGNRNCDLPASSIVPQLTTLLRAPNIDRKEFNLILQHLSAFLQPLKVESKIRIRNLASKPNM